jgi:flagellar biosynthesis/type III secretory pathway M-ring protein FliF/YscJ
MQFLKRYWTQIRAQSADMPANTKLLISSLVVILLLVGYLVIQYAAKPEMVPITGLVGERQAEIIPLLKQRGINVVTEGGQVMVPYDNRAEAIVILQAGGMLSQDNANAFDEVILKSSPWDPSAKTSMAFLQAKNKFLGMVISKMKGVQGAQVVISLPLQTGFGRTHVRPSAAVNIVMQGSGKVTKPLVEAVANLVSGAVAEMSPRDVVVIDARNPGAHHVADADEMDNDQVMANVVQMEARYHQKISDLLRYIPGVIVAVSVRTDAVQHQDIREFKYRESEPLESERSRTSETVGASSGGEPGARSNVGADVVAGGAKGGSSTKTEETETKFAPLPLTSEIRSKKVGQMAQDVNVTVNVPRSFFVGLFKHGKPADTADPDDAALAPLVDSHLSEIKKQIEPLIKTELNPGTVTAHMILDVGAILAMADAAGGGAGGGVVSIVSAEWFTPVLLAAFSIGLMFFMVRKATRPVPLPTAQEIAGVPPQLEADEGLLGEVMEHEASMAGVELGEDEVQVRKVAQQIDELIAEYPAEAASLFKRWVRADGA